MNARMHSRISKRRWGGTEADYYPIHDFMDSTKELCSDARHRVLHTLWGIKRVIVPIFGHTLTNNDGKKIDVKDLCERDHLLVDFGNKFIPTLSDFVAAMDCDQSVAMAAKLDAFHASLQHTPELSELLLSPLAATGQLKSLLLTHNSWFMNSIVPRIFPACSVKIDDFSLSPDDFFQPMRFESWMDNGLTYPPSAAQLQRVTVRQPIRTSSIPEQRSQRRLQ